MRYIRQLVTTSAEWFEGGRGYCNDYVEASVPDPVEPTGEGWELLSSAAAGTRLFWTWVRFVEDKEDE